MKTKFLLPVLAMIFAVGMSFTTNKSLDPANDYLHMGTNSWLRIDEVQCGAGNIDCQAQLGEEGPVFQIYDERNLSTPKKGGTEEPIVVQPN